MKLINSGLSALLLSSVAITAQAEFTGNIGYESEYVFRGVPQERSSAQGGLDWDDGIGDSGIDYYVGTWAADVGEGLEIDYYGGIKGNLGDVNYLLGATAYTYNDDFDETYKEINLGGGWGPFSLDVAVGKYEGELIKGNGSIQNDPNYTVYELKAERNGFYALIGVWGDDAEGEWAELGYGWTWKEVDLGFKYIYTNDASTFDNTDSDNDNQIVVSASYSFAVEDMWNKFQGAIN